MVLWWLRLDGACRYREALCDVVFNDLPQSTRALLERGFETCAAAAAAAAAASGGGGGGRSLRRRAAAALARLRWRVQGRCPLGGDHRAAERKAFRLAFNKGTSLTTISCFPEHLWDHQVMGEYSAGGWTPLHVPLAAGNLVVAERLLRRGDAAAIVTDGIHPIYCVFENYAALDEDTQLQALRLLLRYGFSLNCADGDGKPLVCRAASVCSVKVLEFLFEHGVKTDTRDNSGRNLLHYATKANIVCFLLACDVDPNAADAYGRLPVHSAAIGGNAEALGALLPHTQENALDYKGNSPLHFAAQRGHATVVELLARRNFAVDDSVDCAVRATFLQSEDGLPREKHGSNDFSHRQFLMQKSKYDVNAKNSDGCTALHLAMGNGHLEVSKTLLSCGADAQVLDNNLQSVFDHVFRGNLNLNEAADLLELLMEAGANPCHQDESGRLALSKAVRTRNMKLFSLLLQCGVRVDLKGVGGGTALHLAASSGKDDFVKLLLAHGADPSALDDKGETPLNVASGGEWERHFPTDVTKVIKMLLEAGADPNHRDATGSFPLHRAVKDWDVEAAELLLKHGARVDLKDAHGCTALHLAAGSGKYYIVKLLLAHGADPSALDEKGETPLNVASKGESFFAFEVTQMLLEAGADPNHRDATGSFPLHHAVKDWVVEGVEASELLLKHGARVDLKDAQECTALHLAASSGEDDFVKLLLAHGADPSALDDKGETPLNAACFCERRWCISNIVRVLLEAGADPNHRDATGSFPLLRAVEVGEVEAAELLLEHDARADLADAQGRTALHLAKEYAGSKVIRKKMLVLLKKSLESG